MRSLRGMGHVLLASLTSLLACAVFTFFSWVALAACLEWPNVHWPEDLVLPGLIVFWGLVIGTPIVVVLAAPAYAILLRSGGASFLTASAIGVAPGLLMLPLTRELAVPALAAGLVVGLATHWLCGVRPNKSFKPNPLRGSA